LFGVVWAHAREELYPLIVCDAAVYSGPSVETVFFFETTLGSQVVLEWQQRLVQVEIRPQDHNQVDVSWFVLTRHVTTVDNQCGNDARASGLFHQQSQFLRQTNTAIRPLITSKDFVYFFDRAKVKTFRQNALGKRRNHCDLLECNSPGRGKPKTEARSGQDSRKTPNF
jgi:hypothetical protein